MAFGQPSVDLGGGLSMTSETKVVGWDRLASIQLSGVTASEKQANLTQLNEIWALMPELTNTHFPAAEKMVDIARTMVTGPGVSQAEVLESLSMDTDPTALLNGLQRFVPDAFAVPRS